MRVLTLLIAVVAIAQTDLERRTRENFDILLEGDVSKLSAQFGQELKAKVTDQALRTSIRGTFRGLGAIKQIHPAETERLGSMTNVYLPVDFASGSFRVLFVYDSAGRIGGLWLRPPKETSAWTPAPYAQTGSFRASDVVFGLPEFKLPGTLAVPAGRGPFPGVVLVHGSGPNDRDETVGPNRPFRDLAEGLASAGIAVLRYDKRTRVHGGRGLRTIDDETVDDAVAAAGFLRSQPEIDPARVFVLGHSLGGYALPRIAKADPGIAGIIVVAAPVRSLLDILQDQILSLNPFADPKPQVANFRKMAPESYWQDLEGYNPAAMAAKQNVGMLVVQGERDFNVPMREFRLWQTALKERKNVQFRSYPRLNHLLIAGEGSPNTQEYAKAGHVDGAVVRDIAAFVAGKALR